MLLAGMAVVMGAGAYLLATEPRGPAPWLGLSLCAAALLLLLYRTRRSTLAAAMQDVDCAAEPTPPLKPPMRPPGTIGAPFDLRAGIETEVASWARRAHAKGLELVVIAYDDVPERVSGDATGIARALDCLMLHAIDSTGFGEVVLRCMLEGQHGDTIHLAFSVSGFDPALASTDLPAPCRALAAATGGRMRSTDVPGQPCGLEMEIVVERDRTAAGPGPAQQTLPGQCVLLEANATARVALQTQLRDAGLAVKAPDDPLQLPDDVNASVAIIVVGSGPDRASQAASAALVQRLSRQWDVPLLVCVSSFDPQTLAGFIDAGACACISKPVAAAVLRAALQRCLSRNVIGQAVSPSRLPVRDTELALRMAGDSAAVAASLFSDLCAELPDDIAGMRSSIERRDWVELRQQCHRLRGAAAVCGVPALTAALEALRPAAALGDHAAIVARVEALEIECRRVSALAAKSGAGG